MAAVYSRKYHTNHTHTERSERSSSWSGLNRKLLLATAGGMGVLFLSNQLSVRAQCRTSGENEWPRSSSSLPKVTLYQYQTCPFCSKTRTFLDYYGVDYEVVEVNPLFRREIKFSQYRMVPIAVADGVQVNDSSLIISVLTTCMVNESSSIARSLDLYPEMSFTDAKGKVHNERANKYFIMYGSKGMTEGIPLSEAREEREWREWVDAKLVHAIPPNIYRTPSEALQAFDYISRASGNFTAVERVAAKYVGAVSMYFLSKSLKKKYHLKPDVRESLYDYCKQWTRAIGKERRFMGGSRPNLADLAVYGVLSSVEGLDTFKDLLHNTRIGPWYWAVKKELEKCRQK